MNKVLVAIDPGKYACKAVIKDPDGGVRRITFKNKILKLEDYMDVDTHEGSYKVRFEQTTYIMGSQGEESSYNVTKTELGHKLAVYTAISQLCESGSVLQLVIGCPTNIYRNKELKNVYRDFMLGSRRIYIVVDGKTYEYTIENVLIVPEGSGVVHLKPNFFADKRVAVVDLGGLNMNFTIYNDLVPEVSSMITTNSGGMLLQSLIITAVSSKYGVVIENQDAEQIIKRGYLKIRGTIAQESIKQVEDIIENYVKTILREIQKNNHNLDTMDAIFIGGTSGLVKDHIVKNLNHSYVVSNPEWCNVEGFFKIGELKYAKD